MTMKIPTILYVTILLCSQHLFGQAPRLFLTDNKIDSLKEAVKQEGTHHSQLYQMMKERVDEGDLDAYGSDKNNYRRSYQAVENALVYLLTEDTLYAQQAFALLTEMYTSGDEGTPTIPDTGNYETKTTGSKALTYAFPSMAYGICYDWARSGWSEAQTDTVMEKMQRGLDDWKALFRWELYDMPVSNWVSVCRSAEMVMMLGAGEEENRPQRYDTLKYLLNLHYDLAYGPSAYSNEGIAYINYGVPFAFAANYAALSIGDSGLVSCFEGKSFDKLLMYTFAYTDDKKHLMTSVDSHYPAGEGLFGLVMGNLDSNSLKYYKNFYDYHLGIASGLDDNQKFDQQRFGAVWNFLYYPLNEESENPTDEFDYCLADHEFGAYFIRSRWKNENDILFNAMGKYNYHRKGWQDAETFNIGLIAFGNRFFGGPGKGAKAPNYSSLLIDGEAKESAKHTGEYIFYDETGDEIYIIIGGGSKYAEMGVNDAERHVFVKFLNDTSAIIAILDMVESNTNHSYRWQLNTGHENGDGGISTKIADDNGFSSFLMTGSNDGYVKGWYLSDSDMDFQGHDPLFIETSGIKTDSLWVVMYAGMTEQPEVMFHGSGMNTIMELDNQYLYFNTDSNRIEVAGSMPVNAQSPGLSKDIRIYPVPCDDELVIELLNEDVIFNELKVMNLLGQVVYSKSMPIMNERISLNTQLIRGGKYQLVLCNSEKIVLSKSLIINKND
jgi:hypothetical protein